MDRTSILKFREKLSGVNLSGEQIEYILDTLILNAIVPMMRYTSIVEDTLAESIHLISANQKRKLAIVEGEQLISALFSVVVSDNLDQKVAILKELQLERSIYFRIFEIFTANFNQYSESLPRFFLATKEKDFDRRALEFKNLTYAARGLRCYKSEIPYQEFQAIAEHISKAYKFRSMIVEKYVRHVYMQAVKFRRGTKLTIDLDDLYKNLLLSVIKAINKYRAEKGPLTTQIEWWMKDATTQSATSHEIGSAYHIPPSQRRKMLKSGEALQNFSSAIDEKALETEIEDSLESEIMQASDDSRLSRIAAEADKSRLGFLELGFVYPLNADERAKLRATMVK